MTTGHLDNLYARLGVSISSKPEEIRAAFDAAALKLHPDNNKDPAANDFFLQIEDAYETLSDKVKRAEYDYTLPSDLDQPSEIMVNTLYSRDVLPEIDDPQLVYVLLELMALPDLEKNEKSSRAGLNISLVLDTSTSMAGERLDRVKSTAKELIRQLHPQDYLSMVTFNDNADIIFPPTRGVEEHKIESRINELRTGGGTEIYKGLKAGFDQVRINLSSSLINHIILITDGRTYGDDEKCIALAREASLKGITISGLGIGNEWNDEFVDSLAKLTGGTSIYAADPKDIKKFLTKKFTELSSSYGDNVTLEFSTSPNVEVRYAFRLSPEPGGLSGESPIHMGSIPLGPSLSIIIEFVINSIPKKSGSLAIASGNLKMEIPRRNPPTTIARFDFTRPTRTDPDFEPPPNALVKAMSRLSLYRLQEQARKEIAEGDLSKATVRLQNLATQLLVSGQTNLANIVMLEVQNLERGNTITSDAEKRIKYGTRALHTSNIVEELK